jgi:ABC-type multidrug transport system fused ATPase/permease subunit
LTIGFGDDIGYDQAYAQGIRRWSFLRDIPKVRPYLRPYWRYALASLGLIGLGAGASLLTPWPLAIVIDTIAGKRALPDFIAPFFDSWSSTRIILLAVVGGLAVTAVQHGVGVLGDYVETKLAQHMTLDMRSQLFEHAQGLSQTFHDQARSGALIYTINHAAEAAGHIAVAFPPLAQSLVTLVGMFVIAFQIDPTLALLSLTVVPFVYSSTGFYTRRIEPQLYAVRYIEHNALTIVFEAMKMLRVIVAFGREPYEYGRFRDWAERGLRARVRLTVRQSVFSMAVSLMTAAGTALVLAVGAVHAMRGQLSPGELLVMMAYIAAVYAPLHDISATLTGLQDHVISLRMAHDLLAQEPEVRESPSAVAVGRVDGGVAYEHVMFAYPGRPPALDDVSFEIGAGEKIGIVGATGAGKTTLVSLLPRFYDPQAGRILLDGVDVRELTLPSLRRSVSIVHQEPLLFSGTIAFNIRYGRFEATDEELVAAAEAASAHHFVSGFPLGYETELGEGGPQLSGGERQRIAIARAFLKDAPVLVLDEPTASVDSKTEGLILDALDRLMDGRTTLIVAHRLSTLRNVDSIIVLDGGRVVERGTEEELLTLGGLYAQFHDAQRSGRSHAPPPPPAEAPVAGPRLLLTEHAPGSVGDLTTSPAEARPHDRISPGRAAEPAATDAPEPEGVVDGDGHQAEKRARRWVQNARARRGGGPL